MKIKKIVSFFPGIIIHRISFHIYFWIFIFYSNFLVLYKRNSIEISLLYSFASVAVGMIPVYSHFWALSLIYRKKIVLYIIFLGIIVSIGGFIDNKIFTVFFKQNLSYLRSVYDIGQLVFITTALKFIKKGVSDRFMFQEIRAKQFETELITLKQQIHPHFLFNTLNNLYGLALTGSQKTPEIILKLSELLRYLLDKTQQNYVLLTDEIDFLVNYIELEKLRLNSGEISISTEGDPAGKKIPPMLFIPFVENSFKYGINSITGEFFIDLRFEILKDRLIFLSRNKIYSRIPDTRERSFGTGISNVRRRLELIYPKKHFLSVSSDENEFYVRLEIHL